MYGNGIGKIVYRKGMMSFKIDDFLQASSFSQILWLQTVQQVLYYGWFATRKFVLRFNDPFVCPCVYLL